MAAHHNAPRRDVIAGPGFFAGLPVASPAEAMNEAERQAQLLAADLFDRIFGPGRSGPAAAMAPADPTNRNPAPAAAVAKARELAEA